MFNQTISEGRLILHLYKYILLKDYFKKYFAVLIVLVALALGIYSGINITIQENLNSTLPKGSSHKSFEPILEKGQRAVLFSLDIEELESDIYAIDSLGQYLKESIQTRFSQKLDSLNYKSSVQVELFNEFVQDQIYLFLDSVDYLTLDSSILPSNIYATLKKNKDRIGGYQGIGLAQSLMEDPLHFNKRAYEKISKGQSIDQLLKFNGLLVSSDEKKLLLTSELLFNPQDVVQIQQLTEDMEAFKIKWNKENPKSRMDFFGSFLIAEANANQIKRDIVITANLAVLFIIGLLFFYYRNVLIILFFILPGVFGIACAITSVYFLKGGISALALSASAVIMGIVVDYSFHFFSHLSQEKDSTKTRNAIALPLIVGSMTTIVAFFSLLFANSKALQDFGLFTGFSLLFTVFFILIVFPSFLTIFKKDVIQQSTPKLDTLIGKFNTEKRKRPKWILPLIFIITVFLFVFSIDIGFENDLNKINFYPEALKKREIAHQNINPDAQKRITIVAAGRDKQSAAEINHRLFKKLTSKKNILLFDQINTIGVFTISNEEEMRRFKVWRTFWAKRHPAFLDSFDVVAGALKYNKKAFEHFRDRIKRSAIGESPLDFVESNANFKQLCIEDDEFQIINSVVFKKIKYDKIATLIDEMPGAYIVDGKSIATVLVSSVKADFDFLLLIASATVFLAMLLVYGRIELTLVSFLPMVFSWIWILGLASLLGIKFNFINVMIATIIFGLGDDFAIFITDGLKAQYKYKRPVLATYKTGILLSSISTIIGTGVLFLGGHPAIKSIAAVSVIGISTIVLLSFFVQPFLYRLLITNRTDKGKPPFSLVELLMSIYAFSMFFIGSFITTILTGVVIIVPLIPKQKKKLFVHYLICLCANLLVGTMFLVKKTYIHRSGLDFSRPSIIIANHSSFLDILYLALQSPKLVIMVGPWVYNSIFFGWFIRYADYLPAFEPIEKNEEKVKHLIKDGYSVVVFPEGHRSVDGTLKRFHKGAFYLSEKLKIDITPVLLHGLHYCLPKGEYYVKNTTMGMKVLPRISWNDSRFKDGFSQRTKSISRFFKNEHKVYVNEMENVDYLKYPLLYSYIYKGPVLEWYFRIKYKFEKKNYQIIDALLAESKAIIDLGCGYGFLSYFLYLRDKNRIIKGVDYDKNKVEVAQASYLMEKGISFVAGDVAVAKLDGIDAVIIADVLHYLTSSDQMKTLNNCLPLLADGGLLLIKEALKNDIEKHKWTVKSEKWSTKILRFNKTANKLNFLNLGFFESWANTNGLTLEILNQSDNSSNALMLIRMKKLNATT